MQWYRVRTGPLAGSPCQFLQGRRTELVAFRSDLTFKIFILIVVIIIITCVVLKNNLNSLSHLKISHSSSSRQLLSEATLCPQGRTAWSRGPPTLRRRGVSWFVTVSAPAPVSPSSGSIWPTCMIAFTTSALKHPLLRQMRKMSPWWGR